MALSLLRRCSRLNSAFNLTQSALNQNVVLNRFCKTRLRGSITEGRFYSSQKKPKVFVFSLINPIFLWIQSRMHCFLIRVYFDKDFSVEEFTEGATQAFSHVSGLLSRCQFEALEGLVAEDLIRKLEEKCGSLPSNYKEALFADPDDIILATLADVRMYEDDERSFVRVLMHFWYLTNASIPGEMEVRGTLIFKIAGANEATERLIGANYEFQREFTKGAPSDWIIMRIEHSNILH